MRFFLEAEAELQQGADELPLIIEGDALRSLASTTARPPTTNVRLLFHPTPRVVGMSPPLHGNGQTSSSQCPQSKWWHWINPLPHMLGALF
jgi:hypothetical protein